METRRPNQNNPFGSYGDAETEVRRPQDITSDQWTPISAGSKPTDRTPKGARLTDSDLLVPDVPQKEKTAPVPQRKRPPKKRGKKPRRGEKKAATLPQPPNRQSQRPVVQGTHRDYAAARKKAIVAGRWVWAGVWLTIISAVMVIGILALAAGNL